TNTGGKSAASFTASPGVPVLKVSNMAKVPLLNAEFVGGLRATAFLRNTIPLTLNGSRSGGGIVEATNANSGGSGNGLQGKTDANLASGVYGENSSSGYGLAGRNTSSTHGAVFGENLGTGPALELHAHGGPPMTVDSNVRVDN